MKRLLFLSPIALISLFSFYGCDDENNLLSEENGKPETIDSIPAVDSVQISIVFNCDSLSLHVGESDTIIAIVKNGDVIVDCNVLWSTDSAQVVAVDTNGIVTALSVGTAVITAKYQDVNATCKVTVSEQPIMYEYVDLGLSVMWATFNVGATKPEEYGDYFAWGETETKTDYSWKTYKWCNGSESALTKYCNNHNCGYNGYCDDRFKLDLEDDVAHVKWGGDWRMPTKTELDELINNCTWTLVSHNGVVGYKVVSRIPGYTDKSIFLPATGRRANTSIQEVGHNGYYWSSSHLVNYINALVFDDPCLIVISDTSYYSFGVASVNFSRESGFSVRPVFSSEEWLSHLSISMDNNPVYLLQKDSIRLNICLEYEGVSDYSYNPDITWRSSDPAVATVDKNGVVAGVSKGTVVIYASLRTKTVQHKMIITDVESEMEHDYVDLGLSVNWATCNVGSSIPEGLGDYYAWGEVETKNMYNLTTYKWYDASSGSFTKYDGSDFGVLEPEDDVAHVKWGGNWRMPTYEELLELYSNCTQTMVLQNGVEGYLFTSNKPGYSDQSIFLPAAGIFDDEIYYGNGGYWQSSCSSGSFTSGIAYWNRSKMSIIAITKYTGLTVRPVCP